MCFFHRGLYCLAGESCNGRSEGREESGRLAATEALSSGPELDTVPPLRAQVQRTSGRAPHSALQEHQS